MSFLSKAKKAIKKATKAVSKPVAKLASTVAVVTDAATKEVAGLVKDVPVVSDVARYAGNAGSWGTAVGVGVTALPALVSNKSQAETILAVEEQNRRGAAIAGATVAAVFAAPAIIAGAGTIGKAAGSAAAAIGAVKNVVDTTTQDDGPSQPESQALTVSQPSGGISEGAKLLIPLAGAALVALIS